MLYKFGMFDLIKKHYLYVHHYVNDQLKWYGKLKDNILKLYYHCINKLFLIYLALFNTDILLFLFDLLTVMTDRGKISCRNDFKVFLRIKSIEESKSVLLKTLFICLIPI